MQKQRRGTAPISALAARRLASSPTFLRHGPSSRERNAAVSTDLDKHPAPRFSPVPTSPDPCGTEPVAGKPTSHGRPGSMACEHSTCRVHVTWSNGSYSSKGRFIYISRFRRRNPRLAAEDSPRISVSCPLTRVVVEEDASCEDMFVGK